MPSPLQNDSGRDYLEKQQKADPEKISQIGREKQDQKDRSQKRDK